MRKTKCKTIDGALMVTVEQLQQILNCGYKTATQIGAEAGARIYKGRRVWYHKKKIEKYLENKAN